MKTVLYSSVAVMLAAGSAPPAPAANAEVSAGSPPPAKVSSTADDTAIRPFRVNVPQAALDDLRRRIAATRWPDQETVNDQSQGIQLAKLQGLVRYWGTGYDWRKAEAKLNALPQFVTRIDGVDIHFIHVRSKHPTDR
jgi:epoxide hydrolase-like protein